MESEYAGLIKKLKTTDMVAELADGTVFKMNGIAEEIIASKLSDDEDYFTDAAVAVKQLDRMGALLLVYANVWYVYGERISAGAQELLEDFGIEFEFLTQVDAIKLGKTETNNGDVISYEEASADMEDPREAFEYMC